MKETSFHKKDMPHTSKKEGGSWFDSDTITKVPTANEILSLAIRQELRNRVGTNIFVNRASMEEMSSVVALWKRYKLVSEDVGVYADDTLAPGKVQVRYA